MSDRTPVESRSLRAVGYELSTQELEIEFRSGKVYRYSEVPPEVHAWLLRVPDKALFFSRKIRDAYRWAEVQTAEGPDATLAETLAASLVDPSKNRDD